MLYQDHGNRNRYLGYADRRDIKLSPMGNDYCRLSSRKPEDNMGMTYYYIL